MIFIYILLIVLSVLMEVNFFAMAGVLPFDPIHFIQDKGIVLGTMSVVADKWFLPLGIVGIVLGIICIVGREKMEEQGNKTMVAITIIYFIATFIGLL